MLMAADLSCREGMLSREEVQRTERILRAASLPVQGPDGMDVDTYLEKMAVDKKNLDARIRLVLLRRMGEAIVTNDFSPANLRATLAHYSTRQS
jgi:3-dehydroquinate synthase